MENLQLKQNLSYYRAYGSSLNDNKNAVLTQIKTTIEEKLVQKKLEENFNVTIRWHLSMNACCQTYKMF